ncbi:MAG: gliding motility-associated protein GldE [Bacteroidota bacterium]
MLSLPLWGYQLVSVLTLALVLVVSGFTSASEAALFSLSRQQVAQCREKHKGHKLLRILHDPGRLLATILILNNLFNVAFVTLSTYLLWQVVGSSHVSSWSFLTHTLVFTALLVLFGEIIPKTYAAQHNLWVARRMANWLYIATIVLRPLANLLLYVSHFFGKDHLQERYDLSVDQLSKAVDITTLQEASQGDQTILRRVLNFNTLLAKQIMQPRTHIVAIDAAMPLQELIERVTQVGYSRFPVYQQTIDHIIGLLYTKNLFYELERNATPTDWHLLLQKCLFVPENKKLDALLVEFQTSKIHMAIVVDEYGGTSGLITMEDVLEEIVGEISDEFDQGPKMKYKQLAARVFEFPGSVLLHDFCKAIAVSPTVFEPVKGQSESLGGLLLEIHGRLPQIRKPIVYKQFTFTVMAVDARKIEKVRVHIGEDPDKVDKE